MKHICRLNDAPFKSIKNKTKIIEMRLYDEKRKEFQVGDNLIFINRTTSEELTTTIKGLHIYSSFSDLYARFNKVELGYAESEQAKPEDMEAYYSKEEQQKYGVVGIEIELN